MGIFDFFKPKTHEQKLDALFKKLRKEALVKETTSLMQSFIFSSPHNDSFEDEDPNGTGEFGFTKTNPIPVNGIDNVSAYIDKLRYKYTSKTGTILYYPVTILRTVDSDDTEIGTRKPESDLPSGATSSKNIEGAIDVYNLYSFGGNKNAKLYINSYSLITSNKVPKGFVHRDTIAPIKDGKLTALSIKYLK